MDKPWWGPFRFPRSKRRPRRFQGFDLRVDGRLWGLLAVHFPPGGPSGGILTRGRNRDAWHEAARHTTQFLAVTDLGVALGDFNANRGELREHVATDGTRIAMASNVDGVMTTGAHTTMHRLSAPAGMHGWFVADLTPAA